MQNGCRLSLRQAGQAGGIAEYCHVLPVSVRSRPGWGWIAFSLVLHAAAIAAILFIKPAPKVNLIEPVMQISINMGAPGGDNRPSPVLGHLKPAVKSSVERLLPKQGESQAAQNTAKQAAEIPAQKKQEQKPEPKKQKTEPEPAVKPHEIASKKNDSKPKPEPKKQDDTPKKDSKENSKTDAKQEKTRKDAKDKKSQSKGPSDSDVLKAALAKAQAGAKNSQSNAISSALADARKAQSSMPAGGGGGQGDGEGGGGLYDLYAGQVILAVRPNWSMPTYSRAVLVAGIRVIIDPTGKVLEAKVEQSSSRADFDASAVNAVLRTKNLPPPPTKAQQNMVIRFNSLELMGR